MPIILCQRAPGINVIYILKARDEFRSTTLRIAGRARVPNLQPSVRAGWCESFIATSARGWLAAEFYRFGTPITGEVTPDSMAQT